MNYIWHLLNKPSIELSMLDQTVLSLLLFVAVAVFALALRQVILFICRKKDR